MSPAAHGVLSNAELNATDIPVDKRRRMWIAITCGAGAVGGVATAVPFVSSFAPSERARAAGAPVHQNSRRQSPQPMAIHCHGLGSWHG